MNTKTAITLLLNIMTWVFLVMAGFLLLASGGIALDRANPAPFIWGITLSLAMAVVTKLIAAKLEGKKSTEKKSLWQQVRRPVIFLLGLPALIYGICWLIFFLN